MEDRRVIRAVLREINYRWGQRNAISRDLHGLFDDPFAEGRRELRETFEKNVLDRLNGERDQTHPARPAPFAERLGELRDARSDLDCEACCGVGVLPEGGACPLCEGHGIDLAKRVANPFTSWARAEREDAERR